MKEMKPRPSVSNKFGFPLEELNENLSSGELHAIRMSFPKVHLYDRPLVGTEEIRQYSYCKRILYFRRVVCAPMKKTYKMEVGEEKHERLQKLAKNLDDAKTQKYFNVYLTDPQIGLVGLIDYFEFDGNEAYPVEIKTGNIPPSHLTSPHKHQVAAQAMLIENNFGFLVHKVKIYYVKHKKFIEHKITVDDKVMVMNIVDEITDMLTSERIPKPTPDKGKCIDCECRIYCYNT